MFVDFDFLEFFSLLTLECEQRVPMEKDSGGVRFLYVMH